MIWKENIPEQTDRKAQPTMLVVASDPMLVKLLTMALTLELACEVVTVDHARKAEEAAKHFSPALLILDEGFFQDRALDLSDHLHRIDGLEQLPTLFLNGVVLHDSENKCYPTYFLGWSWKVEAFYNAVRTLLDSTS